MTSSKHKMPVKNVYSHYNFNSIKYNASFMCMRAYILLKYNMSDAMTMKQNSSCYIAMGSIDKGGHSKGQHPCTLM